MLLKDSFFKLLKYEYVQKLIYLKKNEFSGNYRKNQCNNCKLILSYVK